jgi:hypothetical protein
VEHTDEFHIPTAGVRDGIDKESTRIDVVNPHATALHTTFADNALDGTARDEEFFEQAAVKFGQAIAICITGGIVGIYVSFGTDYAIPADDSLNELAYQVVGQRFFAGAED